MPFTRSIEPSTYLTHGSWPQNRCIYKIQHMSCKVLIWTMWTASKAGQFLEHVLWDGLCDPRRDCARLGGAKLWMPPPSHASNSSQPALASVCATWPVCVQLGQCVCNYSRRAFTQFQIGETWAAGGWAVESFGAFSEVQPSEVEWGRWRGGRVWWWRAPPTTPPGACRRTWPSRRGCREGGTSSRSWRVGGICKAPTPARSRLGGVGEE